MGDAGMTIGYTAAEIAEYRAYIELFAGSMGVQP